MKSVFWETGMLIFCMFVFWAWTKDVIGSIIINLLIWVIKILGLSIYDWIWENNIKWGKK